MRKILIVDDMLVSLMMTENILATQYVTVCANSGAEAIEKFRKERPDMVLSDLRMPGMSGYELQTKLQEEFQQVIPFMFMTADHDEETESKGFENGAMDFIRKPFRPDVLLRRIANILQTVEQIQGLKKHASTDALTGLLNKASSEEELDQLCQQAEGALMMIDLDSFKLVNEIHGHSMGDKILISFAEIIRSEVRPNDLVGRMGGDEFIAFCHGINEENVIDRKTKNINEKLVSKAKELMGEDMNIPLGASIGCVFVPVEGKNFSELYKKADKALYVVKQHGKHGYNIFSSTKQLAEMEIDDATSLSKIELILGERNQKEEAMILPLEHFKVVYRFLRRTRKDGNRTDCILLLSLNQIDTEEKIPESEEEEVAEKITSSKMMSEAGEEFLKMLKETLRRSDTLTKSSNGQFVIILYDIMSDDVHNVVNRIERNWQQYEMSKKFSFKSEWNPINN